MINYISKYHLFYLILYVCCTNNSVKDSNQQPLPDNSITKLLNSSTHLNFEKGEISNLDKINGFRNLKFGTGIENLYYEDWMNWKNSLVLEKNMMLEFNNDKKNCKVSVFFIEEKVAKISISWTDESTKLDIENLLVKAFNKPKIRKHYDNIDSLIKKRNSIYFGPNRNFTCDGCNVKKLTRNNIFEDESTHRQIEYNLECTWQSNFVHLSYFNEQYKGIRRDSTTNLLELITIYQHDLNFICREYEIKLNKSINEYDIKVKKESELRNSIQNKNESIEAAKNF